MAIGYVELLEATAAHLEQLKARGVRHVPVQADTLALLSAPLDRPKPKAPAAPKPLSRSQGQKPSTAPAPRSKPAPVVKLRAASSLSSDDPRQVAMNQLLTEVAPCIKCEHLAKSRKNVVFGVGDITSPVMFVGEAPGMDEDIKGEPFVGRAGQLLTKIIQTMGYDRDTVYIANILKCRPDTPGQRHGNRKPTPEEMDTCKPYLLKQIEIIQPKVIVALGATAVQGLLQTSEGINKLRGTWQEFNGIPVMPTFHPSYLLRYGDKPTKRKVWEDMLSVLEKLGHTVTERQKGFFK